MSRAKATFMQAVLFAFLIWLLLPAFAGGDEDGPENPAPVFTQRPATEQEERQWTEEQLYERLLRQQQEAAVGEATATIDGR